MIFLLHALETLSPVLENLPGPQTLDLSGQTVFPNFSLHQTVFFIIFQNPATLFQLIGCGLSSTMPVPPRSA